ncbi:hypothetical protein [uncultured Aquimarina sp.]|uniref:hypothetical protein n=1 Tax=uncultured Aquimarina sp. TaxID=575652 RepID=UPI00261597C0|nr:hypothetical protein [uncultured Aquimarina sp.]
MKTQNNFFKNLGKVVLVLSVLLMASCGDDDDGTAVDQFVTLPTQVLTSYTGNLVYTPGDGSGPIINTSGTATVAVSGNTYTISFSDGVPSLSGLVFLAGPNNNFVSASAGQSTTGISVEDGDLAVGATNSGNTWAFSTN